MISQLWLRPPPVGYLPMTWLLSFLRKGLARSREFSGEAGRAGFTALKSPLNNPLNLDLSET